MPDYADLDQVKTILGLDGSDDDTRLAALNAAASRWLDQQCGVTGFGAAGADVTRTVTGGGFDTLLLPLPLRSVTSITVDGTALDADAYALAAIGLDGLARVLEALDGEWLDGSAVAITGQWADQPYGGVPDLITEAATVLVAGWYRRDRAAGAEVSGPDGLTVRPGNPVGDDRVKTAIAAYRAPVGLAI